MRSLGEWRYGCYEPYRASVNEELRRLGRLSRRNTLLKDLKRLLDNIYLESESDNDFNDRINFGESSRDVIISAKNWLKLGGGAQ